MDVYTKVVFSTWVRNLKWAGSPEAKTHHVLLKIELIALTLTIKFTYRGKQSTLWLVPGRTIPEALK